MDISLENWTGALLQSFGLSALSPLGMRAGGHTVSPLSLAARQGGHLITHFAYSAARPQHKPKTSLLKTQAFMKSRKGILQNCSHR